MKKIFTPKRITIAVASLAVLLAGGWFIFDSCKSSSEPIDSQSISQLSAVKAFRIEPNKDGRYQTGSPAQNLNFTFANNVFKVEPDATFRGNDWNALYTLVGISVNGKALPTLLSPEFISQKNRLSQKHGEVFQVDFTNNIEGLRQDFVVYDGPKNKADFKVSLTLNTPLVPKQAGRNSLILTDAKTHAAIISYQDLKAFDAKGKILKTQMQWEPTENEHEYDIHLVASGENLTYPVTIDPLTAAQWSVEGGADSLNLGTSVAGCDVNGDGFGDMIVGIPGARRDSGEVKVYLGSASGLATMPQITISGFQPSSQFGFSVACLGDVNNDGTDDVGIGAYRYDQVWDPAVDTMAANIDRDEGAVFIYYGKPSAGASMGLVGLDTIPSRVDTIFGQSDTMQLGYNVASAGDVNNDGFDDLIVGAPAYSSSAALQSEGQANIYYGSAMGIPTNKAIDWTKNGGQAYGYFGSAVSGAGNVNNDTYDDFIIGAYGQYNGTDTAQGKVHVFLGGAPPSTTANKIYVGQHKGAQFGISISNAGDVNNDTYDDILIGSDRYTEGYTSDTTKFGEGAIYVYHGGASLPNVPSFKFVGPLSGSGFGASVSAAGDVNDDGIDDIIVGAPYYYSMGIVDRGAAFGLYGSGSGLDTINWFVENDVNKSGFGNSITELGDVNGDGVDDIGVGAYAQSSPNFEEGAAYAFYGIANCGLPKYGSKPVFTYFLDSLLINGAITVNALPGTCGAPVSWDLPTFDANCPGATLMRTAGGAPGSTFTVGTTVVTYRVTAPDNSFRDSSFNVIVIDDQPPMPTMCNETVVVNAPSGALDAVVTYPTPTFSDNCGSITPVLVSGPASGSTQAIGTYQVTYEATDASNNKSVCIFNVLVFEANSATSTCNALNLKATTKTLMDINQANKRTEFSRRLSDDIGNNQASLGSSLLFKIIEGALGIDIPDFVEKGLGVGANGINLAFVNIGWGITPGVDIRYGLYNEIVGADSATIDVDYQAKVCISHPEAEFFGCRDTISVATNLDVLPNTSKLSIDPGVLNQEVGMFLDDLTFGIKFFLNFSACIGIPNPLPIGPSCIGYRASYNEEWDLTPQITIFDSPQNLPLIVTCDDLFQPGINLTQAISCAGGSAPSELIDFFDFIQSIGINPVRYDAMKDQVRYRLPPLPGVTVPDFDLTFGRLTASDLGPTMVVGDSLRVMGCENEFNRFRLDLSSFIDYLLPPALRDSTISGVQLGTMISIFKGLITIDLFDINTTLRGKLLGNFEFNPKVTLQSIDLGIPMSYKVGAGPWSFGQIISNVPVGEKIRLVIPDGVTQDLPINNQYVFTGSQIKARTELINNLDLGLRFIEIGGFLFGLTGNEVLPPLYANDRIFSNPLGPPKVIQEETFNVDFPLVNGPWLLDPDDIPPVVVCKDTTVILNEWGYATVTPESVFDAANSYDLPIGGTGKINLIEVIPDTIYCSDYPEVEAMLVTEDDNCNYDTCTFIITVRDTLKPYIGCRNFTVALDETGVHYFDPANVLIGAIDNCRDLTVTVTPDVFTCEDVGEVNLVEITVRDIAGNINTCIDTVFVIDTIPPALVCPYLPNYPVTRFTDPDVCTYTPDAIEFLPLLTYNDCNVTITYTLTGATIGSGNNNVGGVPFNIGITVVTYTAMDISGNSVSCSFTVIVTDEQAPAFAPMMTPMDLTVECDGLGNTAQLQAWLNNHANAIVTDNCTDMSAIVWTTKLETIDDNCGGTVIYTYSFTATDAAGNFATGTARFIIVDTQAPVISTPAQNILAICNNGSLGIEAILAWLASNGGAVADDVCGDFTWSNNFNFDEANMLCTNGSINVTFTATDECGNASSTTAAVIIDGLDFGDLPDVGDNGMYPTKFEHNGARHGVSPTGPRVFLGASVDTELDGNPSELANGDGIDENGITFLTPLMPGSMARIRFNATNQTAQPATIYAFADFNGDRVLEPITFNIIPIVPATGSLTNADYSFTVPSITGSQGIIYFRFRVSTDVAAAQTTGLAVDGEVEDYRVNLAKVGNLVWQDVNGDGRQGEEEEDLGINGVRVALVFAGLNGTIETNLNVFPPVAAGDDQVFITTTATYTFVDGQQKNGIYYFNALIEGNYDIVFENPKDGTPTRSNNITTSQDEDLDSDGLPIPNTQLVHTGIFTLQGNLIENENGIGDEDLANLLDVNRVDDFPDNRVDQRFDVGYFGVDFGDLPQTVERAGVNYKTTLAQNGPRHIIRPDFFLGACADAEVDGTPDDEAGYKGNGADQGDDATDNDPNSFKVGAACTDDEDGVKFVTPLIPGYEACIEITYALPDNFNGADGYLNAWIDYNGNGLLDAVEQIKFTKLNGATAPLEPNTNALRLEKAYAAQGNGKVSLCFNVPADAQYFQGDMYARFRISDSPRLGPDGILAAETGYPQGRIPYGEVEDYFIPLSKVGNLVWEDRDFDGIQDANEATLGINNVPVALIFSGADGIIQTTNVTQPLGDDRIYHDTTVTFNTVKGIYVFCGLLEDGLGAGENYNYKLVIQTPKDMTPARPNRPAPGAAVGSAGDFIDSDFADGTQTDQVVDNVLSGIVMLAFDIPYGLADNRPLNENGLNDKGQLAPPNDIVLNFPDEQNDETFDVGFAGLDYGEIVAGFNLFAPDDKGDPLEKILMMTLPPVHVIQPGKFLGDCVDAEQSAKIDSLAGSIDQTPPTAPMGDDNMQGAVGQPSNTNEAIGAVACTDDEDGVTFLSPLIMGYKTCIKVKYTLDPAQLNGETWYLRTWSDYNGNDIFEPGEAILFDGLTNNALTPGINQEMTLCFTLPNDPNLYPDGKAYFRFRLTNNPTLGPDGPEVYGNDVMPAGEVEDHLVPISKVGNIVWYDNDLDGIQDGLPSEPAIPGVKIYLDYAGADGNFATTADNTRYEDVTDADGRYFFCGLIQGNYKLTPEKYDNLALAYETKAHITPVHHILTIPNLGVDDDKDSDGTSMIAFTVPNLLLVNWRTGEDGFNDQGSINGYPDEKYDESNDFGWIPEPNLEGITNNVGVDFPTSLTCGNFNLITDICIKNTGYKDTLIGASLEKLQAVLDLDAPSTYGTAFKKVIKVEIATDKTTASVLPVVSGAYNGTNNTNLLDGISGLLKAGEVVCIRVTFEIDPGMTGAPAMPQAQATVSGKAVNLQGLAIPDMCKAGNPQFVAEDLTSDKKAFEADIAPDFPGKYHDMDEPIKLDDCWKKLDISISQNFIVTVKLDEECNATLNAAELIQPYFLECDLNYPLGGFYRVQVLDKEDRRLALGAKAKFNAKDYVGDTLRVQVFNVADFCNGVWGYVKFEDKTPPQVIECPPAVVDEVTVKVKTQTVSGTIGSATALDFSAFTCYAELGQFPICQRPYNVISDFEVDQDDKYTFELEMPTDAGMFSLYQGSFDPNEPCSNIIAQNNVTAYGSIIANPLEARIRIALPLKKGAKYTLVVTTSGADCAPGDPFKIYALSDGDGKIVGGGFGVEQEVERTYDLLCSDVPYIHRKVGSEVYTGVPVILDNCSMDMVEKWFVDGDLIKQGTCDTTYFIRKWYAKDGAGNQIGPVCEQHIKFRPPNILDVQRPSMTVPVECDENIILDAKGNPTPDIAGRPFVISAFGLHELDEVYCNMGATYEDVAEIGVCKGSRKLIRRWTLYNWCGSTPSNPLLLNWKQLIKMGDFTAPLVECPEKDPWDSILTISTGPFDCTASFILPEPKVTENCSDYTLKGQIIQVVLDKEYDFLGAWTGKYIPREVIKAEANSGGIISGIDTGLYILRYLVEDGCGNKRKKDCQLRIADRTEPLAIVDDQITLSLGGAGAEEKGIGYVSTENVDEGSKDNCSPVSLYVDRLFQDIGSRDAYLQDIYGLDFESLHKRTLLTALGKLDIWGIPLLNPDGSPKMDSIGTVLDDTLLRQVDTTFYSWWAKKAYFTCYDIGDSVKVELLVVDGLGSVESYYNRTSNGNIAWGIIVPEDKVPPSCKPPVSIVIPCTDSRVRYEDAFTCADSVLLNQFFGEFTTTDNCGAKMVCVDVKDTRTSCGTGIIIRSYQAMDDYGRTSATCTQTITVTGVNDYVIGFPADKTGACAAVIDTCIFTQENACDILAISVKDIRFEASGDECYKIERTFKVINWCEYDGISDPYVISRDVDGDGKPGDEDIWVIRRTKLDTLGKIIENRTYLDRAGTAADNWSQDLCDTTIVLPSETDQIPAKDTEGKATPITDEFPEATWNGLNPAGSWDWADVAPTGTNDDNSNTKDKLYAKGQRSNVPGDLTNYTTGFWQYTQFIKVYDDVDPSVTFTEQTFCSYSSDIDKGCAAPAEVIFTIIEECTPNNLSIKVFLDAFSNGTFDADNTLPDNTLQAKFGAKVSLNDTTGVVTVTGGSYPLGNHLLEVHVVDGCGNSTVERIPFTMLDCKAPSPVCTNGLAIELMPVIPNADVDGDGDTDTGAFVIWAKDFLASSQFADCSDPVKFALYRADDPILTDSTFVPDTAHTFVTLTCGDYSTQTDNPNGVGGSVLVRVYAIETPRSAQDTINNFDYCETYVLVQNNLNKACTADLNPGVIAGVITTEENKTVQGVSVQLSGQSTQLVNTQAPGKYGFVNLQENYDYTITPLKDKDYPNGVTTLDIVLISKHILGVQPLGSPYKMIAADVNNSKSITTLDLIHLRRVILGISTEFANNTSWRFVEKQYTFPIPTNPWSEDFPEVISVNDLQGVIDTAHFIAVKIGDVNANAMANNLEEIEIRDLRGSFHFEVTNEVLKAGNEYRVDFRASDLAKIQGYQGTFTFDPKAVEILDMLEGISKAENFGWRFVEEGLITMSWNASADLDLEKNPVIFTFVLRAKKDTELSDLLSINSRYTVAEAYDQKGDLLNLGIQFSNGVLAGANFALLQNVPNPFKGRTEIGFFLPNAGEATLTLTDITGKKIKQLRGSYVKGYNLMQLNSAELPSGVLFYTLQSGAYIATKQMVIIR